MVTETFNFNYFEVIFHLMSSLFQECILFWHGPLSYSLKFVEDPISGYWVLNLQFQARQVEIYKLWQEQQHPGRQDQQEQADVHLYNTSEERTARSQEWNYPEVCIPKSRANIGHQKSSKEVRKFATQQLRQHQQAIFKIQGWERKSTNRMQFNCWDKTGLPCDKQFT